MSVSKTQELINAVNEALDPVALVNLIGFLPEKKALSGSTLRAPCPVHRDTEYLTLFVNTRKKTYRCSVESCLANHPDSLVHLYALAKELSPAAAAREIAAKLELPVDLQEFHKLASECYDEAEEHYVKREMAFASQMAHSALMIDKDFVEAIVLLGKIHVEAGEMEKAAEWMLRAARVHLERSQPKEAERVLRRGIALECRPDRMHEALAELLFDQGDMEGAKSSLEKLLQIVATRGDAAEELAILNQLASMEADSPEALERLADACRKHGDEEEAINVQLRLAEVARSEGKALKSIQHLDRALEMNPDFITALDWKADVYLEQGDKPAACKVFKRLSDLATQRGDQEKAREYLERVVELQPAWPHGHAWLGEFLARSGDLRRGVERLKVAAGLERDAGQWDHAIETLERVIELDPDRVEAMEAIADIVVAKGEAELGLKARFAVADEYLARDRRDECLRVLRQLAVGSPDDLDLREELASRMQERGFATAAAEEREALAKLSFKKREMERCQRLVDAGLALDPKSIRLLKLRKELMLALGREAEASAASAKIAEALIEKGRLDEAEETLGEAMRLANSLGVFNDLQRLLVSRGKIGDAAALFLRNAEWLGEAEHRDTGVRAARELLGKDPSLSAVRMGLARLLRDAGDAEAAVAEFRGLAEEHRKAKAWRQAEECLRAVLDLLGGDDPRSRAELLLLQIESGDAEKTRGEILSFLESDSSHWSGGTVRALAEAATLVGGEDPAFMESFLAGMRSAAAKNSECLPAVAKAAGSLARLLEKRDRARAIALLGVACEASPNDLRRRMEQLRLLKEADREEEERAAFDKALALVVGRPDDDADLVEVLLLGFARFPDDLSVLELVASRLDPAQHAYQVAEAADRLAVAASASGDIAAEKRWVEVLLSTGAGDSIDSLRRLAEIAKSTGQRDDHLRAMLRLTGVLRDQKMRVEALEQALEAKRAFPQDGRPREMAVALLREGDDKKALCEALVDLGDFSIAQRSWSRAEMCFREALDLQPDNPEFAERLAQCFEQSGNVGVAEKEYLALAKLWRKKGDLGKAISILHHLKGLVDDPSDHLPLLAELQMAGGRDEDAAQSFLELAARAAQAGERPKLAAMAEKCVELAPKNAVFRRRVAELHAELDLMAAASKHYAAAAALLNAEGDAGGAELCCREALTLNPDLLEARELLLALQQKGGDVEGAADSLRAMAASHSSEGDLEKAAEDYRRLLKLHPSDKQAMTDLSEVLQLLGKKEEASKTLRKLCQALDPDDRSDAEALALHGERLLETSPKDSPLRERVAQALATLGEREKALDQTKSLFAAALETGDAEAARRRLEAMERIAPDSAATRFCRARWLLKSGDEANAVQAYEDFAGELAAAEDAAGLHALCAELADVQRRNAGARRTAVLALLMVEGKPTDRGDKALSSLLADMEEAGRDDDAIATLDGALELFPDNVDLAVRRAELRAKRGGGGSAFDELLEAARARLRRDDRSEALKLLGKALELEPERPEVHLLTAEAKEQMERRDEARTSYAKAIELLEKRKAGADQLLKPLAKLLELDPESDAASLRLIELYKELGKTVNAADVHFQRAKRFARKRQLPESEKELLAALELDPDSSAATRALAEVLAKRGAAPEARERYLRLAALFDAKGKIGQAIQALNSARELDPRHPEPLSRLGDIYARQNNKERALQAYVAAASALSDAKRTRPAMEILEKALAINPEDAAVHRQLFGLFFSLDNVEEAMGQGTRLARFFLRAGDYKQANAVIDKILALREHKPEFFVSVAELYREHDRADLALGMYLEAAAKLAVEEQWNDSLAVLDMAEEMRVNVVDVIGARIDILEAMGVDPRERLLPQWKKLADALATTEGKSQDRAADRAREIDLRNRILGMEPADRFQRERLAQIREEGADPRGAALEWVKIAKACHAPESDEALAALRRALELDPNCGEAAERLARSCAARGEIDNAVEAYVAMARASAVAGDVGKQEASLLQALKIDPSHIGALRQIMEIGRRRQDAKALWNYGFKLATLYEEMSRPEDALTIYEEAVMMDGSNIEAWERLADLNEQLGRAAATVGIYKNIARSHEARGDVEQALAVYERVIKLAPEELDTALEAADLAASRGLPQVAATILEKSIARSAASGEVDPDMLVELCRKLLELAPSRHETRRTLAVLLEERGLSQEAAEEWNNLAILYSADNRVTDALEALKRVRRLDPSSASEVTRRIASLEAASGREEEAARLYAGLVQKARSSGDYEEALRLARAMAEDLPYDSSAEEMAVEICRLGGDADGELDHLCKLADRLIEEGDFPGAESRVAEARALDSRALAPDLVRAKLMIHGGAVAEAQRLLEDVVARAREAESGDDLLRALKMLKKASPENLEARLELLAIHERRGDEESLYRERVEMVEIFFMLGDVDGAADIAEVLIDDPRAKPEEIFRLASRFKMQAASDVSLRLYVKLARKRIALGDYRVAEEALDSARDIKSDDLDLLDLTLSLQEALGEVDEAFATREKMVSASVDAGQLEEAERQLRRMVEINPHSAMPREHLARVYGMRRQPAKQTRELKLAADLYEKANNPEKAYGLLKAVSEIDPEDDEAPRRRVEIAPLFLPPEQYRDDFHEQAQRLINANKLDEFELLAQEAAILLPEDEGFAALRAEAATRTRRPTSDKIHVLKTPTSVEIVRLAPGEAPPRSEAPPPSTTPTPDPSATGGASRRELPGYGMADPPRFGESHLAEASRALESANGGRKDEELDFRIDTLWEEPRALDDDDDIDVTAVAPARPSFSPIDPFAYLAGPAPVEEPAADDLSPVVDDDLSEIDPTGEQALLEPPRIESEEREFRMETGEFMSPDLTESQADIDRIDAVEPLRFPGESEFDQPAVVDPNAIRALIQSGRPQEAIDDLQAALRARSTGDTTLLMLLAEAHFALGNTPMAVQELAAAHHFLPSPADPRRLEIFRSLHSIEPDNAKFMAGLVDALYDFDQIEEAEGHAFALSLVYRERGLRDMAERVLRRMLERDPKHAAAMQELIATREEQGAAPEDIALDFVTLANALTRQGEKDEASRALDRAFAKAPRSSLALAGIVKLRRRLGPPDLFLDELTRLASLYVDEGHSSSALRLLDEAEQIAPASATRDDLRVRAQQLTPTSAHRMVKQQSPHESRADRNDAIQAFQAVLMLDADNIDVHGQLAKLFNQTGDESGEAKHLGEIVRVYEEQGQWSQLVEILPGLTRRFPRHQAFAETLQRARIRLRELSVGQEDRTQTSFEDFPASLE